MARSHSASMTPNYRPDIDGLRAVAVLLTVGFHAFPGAMHGGFIGVDIFFVISGYLISKIIFDTLEQGRFSSSEFYLRRIKRIFPALCLVLLACLAFGWVVLLPDEYQQLGKHVGATASFMTNIALWDESSYFALASELKPLLHLWSLGVEEQFYALWPAMVWLSFKLKMPPLALVITVLVASFSLNIFYASSNLASAFYLPGGRFWEPLSGALLVAWPRRRGDRTLMPYFGQISPWLGAICIAVGVVLIGKESSFPGWWALLPVGGAVLILAGDPHSWFSRIVLANRLAVAIGLISYPLYLWHWPLLAFARILGADIGNKIIFLLLILSFVLATFTYYFVEKPIRSSGRDAGKVVGLSLVLATLGCLGFVIYARGDLSYRPAVDESEFAWDFFLSPGCREESGLKSSFCIRFGNPEKVVTAIIGDSTGNAMAAGIGEGYAARGLGMINIGSFTCPPIRGLGQSQFWGQQDDCLKTIDWEYEYVLKSKTIETVVLAIFARDLQFWGVPGVPGNANVYQRFEVVKQLLNRDIADLKQHGKKVIVAYDLPSPFYTARLCVDRPLSFGEDHCILNESQLSDRHPYFDLFDSAFRERSDVCVFRQSEMLLQENKLHVLNSLGQFRIRDTTHLTYVGSKEMAKYFFASPCLKN